MPPENAAEDRSDCLADEFPAPLTGWTRAAEIAAVLALLALVGLVTGAEGAAVVGAVLMFGLLLRRNRGGDAET